MQSTQTARIGSNIVLDKIPVHARIQVIEEGNIRPKQAVGEDYERLRPLEERGPSRTDALRTTILIG